MCDSCSPPVHLLLAFLRLPLLLLLLLLLSVLLVLLLLLLSLVMVSGVLSLRVRACWYQY